MLVQSHYSRHTKQRLQFIFMLALSALLITALLPVLLSKSATPITHVSEKVHTAALPLSFEPNVGQADSSVHYVGHAPGGLLLFAPSRVIIALKVAGTAAQKTLSGKAVA